MRFAPKDSKPATHLVQGASFPQRGRPDTRGSNRDPSKKGNEAASISHQSLGCFNANVGYKSAGAIVRLAQELSEASLNLHTLHLLCHGETHEGMHALREDNVRKLALSKDNGASRTATARQKRSSYSFTSKAHVDVLNAFTAAKDAALASARRQLDDAAGLALANASLQELHLGWAPSVRLRATVAGALAAAQQLSHVSLAGSCLGDEALQSLGSALQNCPSLRHLDLRACAITDSGIFCCRCRFAGARRRDMLTWHMALRQYPDPSLPEAARRTAQKSALRQAEKAAAESAGLHSLILDDNEISDGGCEELVTAICQRVSLRHLSLAHNKISPTGVQRLLNVFTRRNCLRCLDLRGNDAGDLHTKETGSPPQEPASPPKHVPQKRVHRPPAVKATGLSAVVGRTQHELTAHYEVQSPPLAELSLRRSGQAITPATHQPRGGPHRAPQRAIGWTQGPNRPGQSPHRQARSLPQRAKASNVAMSEESEPPVEPDPHMASQLVMHPSVQCTAPRERYPRGGDSTLCPQPAQETRPQEPYCEGSACSPPSQPAQEVEQQRLESALLPQAAQGTEPHKGCSQGNLRVPAQQLGTLLAKPAGPGPGQVTTGRGFAGDSMCEGTEGTEGTKGTKDPPGSQTYEPGTVTKPHCVQSRGPHLAVPHLAVPDLAMPVLAAPNRMAGQPIRSLLAKKGITLPDLARPCIAEEPLLARGPLSGRCPAHHPQADASRPGLACLGTHHEPAQPRCAGPEGVRCSSAPELLERSRSPPARPQNGQTQRSLRAGSVVSPFLSRKRPRRAAHYPHVPVWGGLTVSTAFLEETPCASHGDQCGPEYRQSCGETRPGRAPTTEGATEGLRFQTQNEALQACKHPCGRRTSRSQTWPLQGFHSQHRGSQVRVLPMNRSWPPSMTRSHTPSCSSASQDLNPCCALAFHNLKPCCASASHDLKPCYESVSKDLNPRCESASQDLNPCCALASQDLKPCCVSASQDLKPCCASASQDLTPAPQWSPLRGSVRTCSPRAGNVQADNIAEVSSVAPTTHRARPRLLHVHGQTSPARVRRVQVWRKPAVKGGPPGTLPQPKTDRICKTLPGLYRTASDADMAPGDGTLHGSSPQQSRRTGLDSSPLRRVLLERPPCRNPPTLILPSRAPVGKAGACKATRSPPSPERSPMCLRDSQEWAEISPGFPRDAPDWLEAEVAEFTRGSHVPSTCRTGLRRPVNDGDVRDEQLARDFGVPERPVGEGGGGVAMGTMRGWGGGQGGELFERRGEGWEGGREREGNRGAKGGSGDQITQEKEESCPVSAQPLKSACGRSLAGSPSASQRRPVDRERLYCSRQSPQHLSTCCQACTQPLQHTWSAQCVLQRPCTFSPHGVASPPVHVLAACRHQCRCSTCCVPQHLSACGELSTPLAVPRDEWIFGLQYWPQMASGLGPTSVQFRQESRAVDAASPGQCHAERQKGPLRDPVMTIDPGSGRSGDCDSQSPDQHSRFANVDYGGCGCLEPVSPHAARPADSGNRNSLLNHPDTSDWALPRSKHLTQEDASTQTVAAFGRPGNRSREAGEPALLREASTQHLLGNIIRNTAWLESWCPPHKLACHASRMGVSPTGERDDPAAGVPAEKEEDSLGGLSFGLQQWGGFGLREWFGSDAVPRRRPSVFVLHKFLEVLDELEDTILAVDHVIGASSQSQEA
eukprot:jgi/Botrbrau1/22435/Bobra.0091s0037.1